MPTTIPIMRRDVKSGAAWETIDPIVNNADFAAIAAFVLTGLSLTLVVAIAFPSLAEQVLQFASQF